MVGHEDFGARPAGARATLTLFVAAAIITLFWAAAAYCAYKYFVAG